MIRADVGRRIGDIWNEYQRFLNKQKIGELTVKELLDTAPDAEAKIRILQIACGPPPYSDLSCGFLAWQTKGYEVAVEKSSMGEPSLNHNTSLRGACKEVGISEEKCDNLESIIAEVCQNYCKVPAKKTKKEKVKRPLTNWQRCVKEGMAGKEWDPQRITELSKLYKEGKCPTNG